MRTSSRKKRGGESGAVVVEFAILGPVFLVMLCGIMAWGNYFWMSHAVQQVANDAARASLAGLNAGERLTLARQVVTSEIDDYAALEAAQASVATDETPDRVTVTVSYDASNSPFWALSELTPMPSSTIRREATIRLGGY
jgi:Flp pilus assembly protein TadG